MKQSLKQHLKRYLWWGPHRIVIIGYMITFIVATPVYFFVSFAAFKLVTVVGIGMSAMGAFYYVFGLMLMESEEYDSFPWIDAFLDLFLVMCIAIVVGILALAIVAYTNTGLFGLVVVYLLITIAFLVLR